MMLPRCPQESRRIRAKLCEILSTKDLREMTARSVQFQGKYSSKGKKTNLFYFFDFLTLQFCIASHTEKNRNIFAKIFVKSLFFFLVFLQFCYSIPAVTEAVYTVYTLLIIFILFLYCQQLKIQVYIEPGARNLNTAHANKTGLR